MTEPAAVLTASDVLDRYVARIHESELGCKRGLKCKQHDVGMPKLRRDLIDLMGELLDMFEVNCFGDPLPQEEREWARFEQEKAEGPFGKGKR